MLPERLNNLFAKRGGDLLILVFSLLLAFFMWGMHRFTQKYSTFFDYKIEADSNIGGRAKSAVSYNSLVMRGKATGFYILQQRLSERADMGNINLSIDAKELKPVTGRPDFFYIRSEEIKEKVQEALGNDFELESITTDTLYFQFPRQANKKVPVAVRKDIEFAGQYTSIGSMQLRPDSVVVYGNEALIKNIDSVYTQVIVVKNADSPIQGVVRLKGVDGVRFSEDHLYYSLSVGRYFEDEVTAKVNVINAPASARLIVIPQEIKLSYRMLFENKKEMDASDFQVVVDYNKIGDSNIARPYIIKSPDNIFSVKMEPMFVECIVN